jgi:hypothetical protein
MKIYKLKYTDKETAIADLESKNITRETVIAIVEIGTIEGIDGYHYDLMLENDIDFGINEIQVNNPVHNFWV